MLRWVASCLAPGSVWVAPVLAAVRGISRSELAHIKSGNCLVRLRCRYDPDNPNDTRQVDEPTLGHCNFNSTAPCGMFAFSLHCVAREQPRC